MRIPNVDIRQQGQAAVEYLVCFVVLITSLLLLPDDVWASIRVALQARFEVLSSSLAQP